MTGYFLIFEVRTSDFDYNIQKSIFSIESVNL